MMAVDAEEGAAGRDDAAGPMARWPIPESRAASDKSKGLR
jgi:hypothetical protein